MMKQNKHLPLLIFSMLVLLGGCLSQVTQQKSPDVSLKECLYFYNGNWDASRHLCDSKEDCVEVKKKLLESEIERLDPEGIDPTYQDLRDELNIDNYKCESTEMVPLLREGQEIICSSKSDCFPISNYPGILSKEVLFCEDGVCKVTKYSQEVVQETFAFTEKLLAS